MAIRNVTDRVQLLGTIDWDRRLFDALIPLPHGTSYNAYLVKGSQKSVLIDTDDAGKEGEILNQLETLPGLDYVVANHAEQDHSGALPAVMGRFPEATLLCSEKAKSMLMDLLPLEEARIRTVKDGETLSLGDRTLEFIYTPWVHWPETMSTYLREEKILFSCDFFGSHLATADTFVKDENPVLSAAKRYYAEIMMPFRAPIVKNLERLDAFEIKMIAPSHGPIYNRPELIMDAYREWVTFPPKNQVIIPYISMHHSTLQMVKRLEYRLRAKGIKVASYDLTATDVGELAMALVDAATIIFGTPVMLGNAHPNLIYGALLASALKPKALFAGFMVSYGWGAGTADKFPDLVPGLRVEWLPTVSVRGLPREDTLESVDALAEQIVEKHRAKGLIK